MNKRVKYEIAQVGEVVGGSTPSTKDESNYGGDVAWITPKDLSSFDGRYIKRGERNITPKGLASCSARLMPKNTILFSSRAPIGYIAIADNELCTNQGFKSIVANESRIHYLFLYYYLIYKKKEIEGLGSGTTFKEVSGSVLKKYQIEIPENVFEQRSIAETLSCLDDMIELNNRTNQLLGEMTQALFKQWFVDFEFPNENGRPYKFSGGAMVDSELGEIPKGWRVYRLSEIFEINPNRRIVRGTIAPYLDMSNMPTQGHTPSYWIKREFSSGMKFMNGDTLVARITPCLENGKTAYVDFLEEGQVGWGSTEYIVLRPRSPISTILAYILARSDRFRDYAIKRMTGSSGRQRVPADTLALYQIAMPPLENSIHEIFGILMESLFESIKVSAQESRAISQIRDTLLPKLMSGEIRVPLEEVC